MDNVVLDFGHNPEGIKATIERVVRMTDGKKLKIVLC